jgi:hypothetical protein
MDRQFAENFIIVDNETIMINNNASDYKEKVINNLRQRVRLAKNEENERYKKKLFEEVNKLFEEDL